MRKRCDLVQRLAAQRHLGQVRQEPPLGLVVGVADVVANHRALAGQFAAAGHRFILRSGSIRRSDIATARKTGSGPIAGARGRGSRPGCRACRRQHAHRRRPRAPGPAVGDCTGEIVSSVGRCDRSPRLRRAAPARRADGTRPPPGRAAAPPSCRMPGALRPAPRPPPRPRQGRRRSRRRRSARAGSQAGRRGAGAAGAAPRHSRRGCGSPGRACSPSALLTRIRSAISMMPRLTPCSSSPPPGAISSTKMSVMSATMVSD